MHGDKERVELFQALEVREVEERAQHGSIFYSCSGDYKD